MDPNELAKWEKQVVEAYRHGLEEIRSKERREQLQAEAEHDRQVKEEREMLEESLKKEMVKEAQAGKHFLQKHVYPENAFWIRDGLSGSKIFSVTDKMPEGVSVAAYGRGVGRVNIWITWAQDAEVSTKES